MSTNNNYTPRHASSAAVEPDSEPLVAGDGAEAAFATLVSDALAERQAAREAAARQCCWRGHAHDAARGAHAPRCPARCRL